MPIPTPLAPSGPSPHHPFWPLCINLSQREPSRRLSDTPRLPDWKEQPASTRWLRPTVSCSSPSQANKPNSCLVTCCQRFAPAASSFLSPLSAAVVPYHWRRSCSGQQHHVPAISLAPRSLSPVSPALSVAPGAAGHSSSLALDVPHS